MAGGGPLTEANDRGWTVVSMRDGFKVVFAQ
jgi:hypothetical protein